MALSKPEVGVVDNPKIGSPGTIQEEELNWPTVAEMKGVLSCVSCGSSPGHPVFQCEEGHVICELDGGHLETCPGPRTLEEGGQNGSVSDEGVRCGAPIFRIVLQWMKYMTENAHYSCPIQGCSGILVGEGDREGHMGKAHPKGEGSRVLELDSSLSVPEKGPPLTPDQNNGARDKDTISAKGPGSSLGNPSTKGHPAPPVAAPPNPLLLKRLELLGAAGSAPKPGRKWTPPGPPVWEEIPLEGAVGLNISQRKNDHKSAFGPPTPLPRPSGSGSSRQPLPGSSSSRQPLPGSSSSLEPLPGSSSSRQPLPGSSSSRQPLPGSSSSLEPLPGSSSSRQPLPGSSSSRQPLQSAQPEAAEEQLPFRPGSSYYRRPHYAPETLAAMDAAMDAATAEAEKAADIWEAPPPGQPLLESIRPYRSRKEMTHEEQFSEENGYGYGPNLTEQRLGELFRLDDSQTRMYYKNKRKIDRDPGAWVEIFRGNRKRIPPEAIYRELVRIRERSDVGKAYQTYVLSPTFDESGNRVVDLPGFITTRHQWYS